MRAATKRIRWRIAQMRVRISRIDAGICFIRACIGLVCARICFIRACICFTRARICFIRACICFTRARICFIRARIRFMPIFIWWMRARIRQIRARMTLMFARTKLIRGPLPPMRVRLGDPRAVLCVKDGPLRVPRRRLGRIRASHGVLLVFLRADRALLRLTVARLSLEHGGLRGRAAFLRDVRPATCAIRASVARAAAPLSLAYVPFCNGDPAEAVSPARSTP
jgi:hypothetical protein